MAFPPRLFALLVVCVVGCLSWSGCRRDQHSRGRSHGPYSGADPVHAEVDAFRYKIRGYYNSSTFNALEKSMAEIRAAESPVFGNGSWKIYQFYSSLGCDDREAESMWQLHDRIHQAWIAAYPDSSTARIAYADFWTDYAWHARSSKFADKVTKEGWRLFAERLAKAQKVLDEAKPMEPACPMWWEVQMTVALGEGWAQPEFMKVYQEAKEFAPQFFAFDNSLAYYLLPRWYGKPGDWEKAMATEMKRPSGLGAEGYARVVSHLRDFYGNIFRESKASWPDTRAGFEIMREKYPQSLEILSLYCQAACLAGERPLARQLFEQLNGYIDPTWGDAADYKKSRDWAFGGKAP